MRLVTHDEVLSSLSARQIVDAQSRALLSSRRTDLTAVRGDATGLDGQMLFSHGCRVPGLVTAFKVGVQVPSNRQRAMDAVQASVLLQDSDSGEPLALLDGAAITAARTAGGLVAGLEMLAGRRSSGPLAILGSGPQGRMVARLAHEALGVDDIRMWSPGNAVCTDEWARRTPSARMAVEGASMVACCTSSRTPVVSGDWVDEGALIATMGSYAPDRCEVPVEVTLACERVVIDQPDARTEVGPVVAGLAAGLPDRRVVELLDLVPDERVVSGLTSWHCKGLGIQDAFAAAAVYFEWPEFVRRLAGADG